MALKKIQHVNTKPISLSYQVAEMLSQAILEGDLKGGDQLVELELQDYFGISRSPLREAFRELEKKGLVEIIPRKGTFVKRITRKDVEEHFPVRAELEGLAARMAAVNMTRTALRQMEELMLKMERAVKEKDTKAYYEYHLQFHDIFIDLSGNGLLIDLLKNLRTQSIWHRYAFQYYQEDLEKAFTIHWDIIGLFKKVPPDPDAVSTIVRHHINVALDRFLEYLETSEHN